jgi:hypothetical protein
MASERAPGPRIERVPLREQDLVVQDGEIDGVAVGSLIRVGEALATTDSGDVCAVCGAEALLHTRTRFSGVNLCHAHSGEPTISDDERRATVAVMVAAGRLPDVVAAYWSFAIKRAARSGDMTP